MNLHSSHNDSFSTSSSRSDRKRSFRQRRDDAQPGFESLESRNLLAGNVFDSVTGTLFVTYEATDSLVELVARKDQLSVVSGGVLGESEAFWLGAIQNIDVRGFDGAAQSLQSLALRGDFRDSAIQSLMNVSIRGVNEVLIDSQMVLGGDLWMDLDTARVPDSTHVTQTANSLLTVQGGTFARAVAGDIDLSHGTNDFVGPVQFANQDGGLVAVSDINELRFEMLKLEGPLNATAGTIVDTVGTLIDVRGEAFMRADSILLGNDASDDVQLPLLNFAVEGPVDISAARDITLFGNSTATSARLRVTGSILDTPVSQVFVSGLLDLTAETGISLGVDGGSELDATSLRVISGGDAAIADINAIQLDLALIDNDFALTSGGSLISGQFALMVVAGDFAVKATSINLGTSSSDLLQTGRLSFASAGDVTIHENDELVVFGVNAANNLTLFSPVNMVTDEMGTETVVANQATFTGTGVTYGKESSFSTAFLTLHSAGNVTVHEVDDMLLVGSSIANSFRLVAGGTLSNAIDASIVATFRLDVAADVINLGTRSGDRIESQSLRFNSTGATTISTDNDILIVLDNHAQSLSLTTLGDIRDQPGATIMVDDSTFMSAMDIILGDSPDECFSSPLATTSINAAGTANITFCP